MLTKTSFPTHILQRIGQSFCKMHRKFSLSYIHISYMHKIRVIFVWWSKRLNHRISRRPYQRIGRALAIWTLVVTSHLAETHRNAKKSPTLVPSSFYLPWVGRFNTKSDKYLSTMYVIVILKTDYGAQWCLVMITTQTNIQAVSCHYTEV